MGLLQKIAWKTRKWNLRVNLFDILLHDNQRSWGISILNINYNFRSYSLFSVSFRLPNGADVKKLSIDEFDLLFLHNYLWKTYDNLSDSKLWGGSLSKIDDLKLLILTRLFK